MFYDTIIVGAGPAGVQAGYLCKKYKINYIIIEKNDKCASFFDHYPHSGRLISINKKHTGSDNKDFNLRHDWNSLLNDEELLMTNYTDDYYPTRETLVKYINDIYMNNNLNIIFNKYVNMISKNDNIYSLKIVNNDKSKTEHDIFTCNKLIIATGLSIPYYNLEYFYIDVKEELKHYYHYPENYFKDNINDFANKSVCIFGGGNSGHEIANILIPVSNKILIYYYNNAKWALSTHYVGDLRSVYLPFMDTFALKSLNGIDNLQINYKRIVYITQKNKGEKYTIRFCECDKESCYSESYDHILFSSGWKFDNSIFDFDISLKINDKYPFIKYNFESVNNDNLYFIGELAHSLDYKKGSGGFIHGFRYLIKIFFKLNYDVPHEITNFNIRTLDDTENFCKFICNRLNTSSDIYQMHGLLGDIFYYNSKSKIIDYYSNVYLNSQFELNKNEFDFVFCLSLEYGKIVTDITEFDKTYSSLGKESASTFLHPILKIFNKKDIIDIIHFDENLFAKFETKIKYLDRFVRLFKAYFIL